MQKSTSRILEAAKKEGISDQALCRILNANRNKIDDWKNDKSKPTLEEIAILCPHIKISADYIIGITDEPFPPEVSDETKKPATSDGQPATRRETLMSELLAILEDQTEDELERNLDVVRALKKK